MSKRAEFRRQQKKDIKKTKTYILTQEQISKMKEDAIVNFVEKAQNLNGFYVLTEPQIQKMKEDAVQEAVDTSFGLMLSIPANVLSRIYWEKSAPKRIPQFLDECLSVYESIGAGSLTITELIEDVEKVGKLKMNCVARLKQLRKAL